MADEYVERIVALRDMGTDDLQQFCAWIADSGAGTFNQMRASFNDGSRAYRTAYNGPWIIETGIQA